MNKLWSLVLYALGLNEVQRCRYCGHTNDADEAVCDNCEKVILRTFLVESLVSLLCCCFLAAAPIGCAIRAHIEISRDNYEAAEKCAEWAKKLYWVTLGVGAVVYLVYGLFLLFAIGTQQ